MWNSVKQEFSKGGAKTWFVAWLITAVGVASNSQLVMIVMGLLLCVSITHRLIDGCIEPPGYHMHIAYDCFFGVAISVVLFATGHPVVGVLAAGMTVADMCIRPKT